MGGEAQCSMQAHLNACTTLWPKTWGPCGPLVFLWALWGSLWPRCGLAYRVYFLYMVVIVAFFVVVCIVVAVVLVVAFPIALLWLLLLFLPLLLVWVWFSSCLLLLLFESFLTFSLSSKVSLMICYIFILSEVRNE